MVSCLKGIFAAATMSGNLLAIHSESVAGQSAATRLNGATFVDATAKLGDCADRLGAVEHAQAGKAAQVVESNRGSGRVRWRAPPGYAPDEPSLPLEDKHRVHRRTPAGVGGNEIEDWDNKDHLRGLRKDRPLS